MTIARPPARCRHGVEAFECRDCAQEQFDERVIQQLARQSPQTIEDIRREFAERLSAGCIRPEAVAS